jgi:outer membrane protein TolC
MGSIVPRPRLVMHCIFWSFLLAIAGCRAPQPFLTEEFEEELRTIETLSLEEESLTPPVTLEEAEAERELEKPAAPSESLEITIEEIRKTALENNLDLMVELVNPSISETSVSEEEAKFEATFFGSSEVFDIEPPTLPLITGSPRTETQHEVGVQFPLRTGGTATVSLPINSVNLDVPGAPTSFQSLLAFSISQPLLRNAGLQVNEASITVAKLERRQVDSRTKLAAIRILADAERAYWAHYAAGRELEVRHQQYELAIEQQNLARRLADLGAVAEIESTRAAVGVARRVEAVIAAETRRRATQRNLKRIMNMPGLGINSAVALTPKTEPRPLHLTLDADALAERAVANRMELLEVELQLAIDALTIDVTRRDEFPVFTLGFDYSFGNEATSLGAAFDDLFDRDIHELTAGAAFEVPLGNRAARSRHRRAVLQRIASLSTKRQRSLGIRQEVYDSVDQLEKNWQSILAARYETLTAARVYEAEQRQFKAGVRTSTEVLEAADFLAEGQIREILALAGYEIAKIEIAFATGTLLGKGRVRITPYQP